MADTTQEVIYSHTTADPHTAVPDWIALCPKLSDPARHMAHVLILLGRAGRRPTQAQLADLLGADRRSITRWGEELIAAGHATMVRAGRRSLLQLHAAPTCDSPVAYRTWDSGVRNSNHGLYDLRSLSPICRKRVRRRLALYDALERIEQRQQYGTHAHGGGGGHDQGIDPPPPEPSGYTKTGKPTIGDLRTATGRWMLAEGFSLAASVELQAIDLAAAKADYSRRRNLGQNFGAIVTAWRVEAPAAGSAGSAGSGPWDAAEIQRVRDMLGYENQEDDHAPAQ